MRYALMEAGQLVRYLHAGTAFTLRVGKDDVQFPENFLSSASEAERRDLNIFPVVQDPMPDPNENIVSGGAAEFDGKVYRETWKSTPRPIEYVRERALRAIADSVASRLAPTDWAYVRKAETGEDVPDAIRVQRAAIRAAAKDAEAAIAAATTAAGVRAAYKVEWP